jgi:hypothetical protein
MKCGEGLTIIKRGRLVKTELIRRLDREYAFLHKAAEGLWYFWPRRGVYSEQDMKEIAEELRTRNQRMENMIGAG